jgi:hypothetical protein
VPFHFVKTPDQRRFKLTLLEESSAASRFRQLPLGTRDLPFGNTEIIVQQTEESE